MPFVQSTVLAGRKLSHTLIKRFLHVDEIRFISLSVQREREEVVGDKNLIIFVDHRPINGPLMQNGDYAVRT